MAQVNGMNNGGAPAMKRLCQTRNGVAGGTRNGVAGGNWVVRSSLQAQVCVNPVRSCEEKYFKEAMEKRDKSKELIKLSIGDPSVFGNLPPPPCASEGIQQAVASGKYNGYAKSCGMEVARQALADKYSTDQEQLNADDIILTNACSGALLMSFEVLCDPGSSILMPTPGFGLYKCHADALGLHTKMYKLLPEKNWEIDLDDLEKQLDDTVSAIVVNYPSNPCGCVYSREHLLDLLQVAERHHCPIISDDIYQDMVFAGQPYVSLASLSANVPILSCGGVSKRYMIPGWRLGWIIMYDRNKAFEAEIKPGLLQLAMKLLGPCTLVQAAIPHILQATPQEYHDRNMGIVKRNAELVFQGLKDIPGLNPVMPAGAMYMIVLLDTKYFSEFDSDVTFTKRLLVEESVFCLPGSAFCSYIDCFRIVLMMPDVKIGQALERIAEFCTRHYST